MHSIIARIVLTAPTCYQSNTKCSDGEFRYFLRVSYALSGTVMACVLYLPTHTLRNARYRCSGPTGLSPRRCYRFPIGLRTCYAMSGTDLAYAATSLGQPAAQVNSTTVLRSCYAMSGTDLAQLR
eukprot:3941981-Rhodomonas_salina.4